MCLYIAALDNIEMIIMWLSVITVIASGTVKPVYNDHLVGYFSAFWSSSRWAKGHLDELQKADIVGTSELVPSVIIKTHYWINHR